MIATISNLRCKAAVAPDDAVDFCADLFRQLERADQIGGNVLRLTAAADGKHQKGVLSVETRPAQPSGEYCVPPIVIGASCQFGDVVRGSIGFEAAYFPKIIDGMASVSSRPAYAKDKETAPIFANMGKSLSYPLDLADGQFLDQSRRFGKILPHEIHLPIPVTRP